MAGDPFDDSAPVGILRKAFFSDADSEQAIWGQYKSAFLMLDPMGRRADIGTIDRHIGEQATPSRETATLISYRRQLADLDDLLRRSCR